MKFVRSRKFKSFVKSACLLSAITLSHSAFADRNPNVTEACAQFKLAAARLPADEVTFRYSKAPNETFNTYYKGEGAEYHTTPEDRKIRKLVLLSRGDIYASPSSKISKEDYRKFFSACNLAVDEDLWPLGILLIEVGGFDDVTAAKALEESEWFDIVHPMFIIKPLE